MSKTKFTPGPWNTGGIFNPGTELATQSIWGPTPRNAQSGVLVAQHARIPDARLISAAPDLYEALDRLRSEVRDLNIRTTEDDQSLADLGMACDAADAALAKARGESK